VEKRQQHSNQLSFAMCEGIAYGDQQCQRKHWLTYDSNGKLMCRDHKNGETYAHLVKNVRTKTQKKGEDVLNVTMEDVIGYRTVKAEIKGIKGPFNPKTPLFVSPLTNAPEFWSSGKTFGIPRSWQLQRIQQELGLCQATFHYIKQCPNREEARNRAYQCLIQLHCFKFLMNATAWFVEQDQQNGVVLTSQEMEKLINELSPCFAVIDTAIRF
jgi:hypothetical protein